MTKLRKRRRMYSFNEEEKRMKNKKGLLRRVVSLVTVVCIIATIVGENVRVRANEERYGEKSEIKKILEKEPVIPREYGKVTMVLDRGKEGVVIVNIQDLHSHEGTQKNIEKII
jgi:hypothetical protein